MTVLLERPGAVATSLDAIDHRHVALAIEHRSLPARLVKSLGGIDLTMVVPMLLSARIGNIGAAVSLGLAEAGYPEVLCSDIATLAQRLAEIMNVGAVTIRLEPVTTDACKQFHADYVTVRLLTTYVGRGTQWSEEAAIEAMHSLACGDIALFKGRLLLDPPTVLHRSPPIAGTGERRLLLVIDPVHAA